MTKVKINPKILNWARESSNYSLLEVARRLNKKVEDIKLWEEGKDYPTYFQLEKLAYSIYKRPIAIFFFPEPPREDSTQKSFRTLPKEEIENLSPFLMKIIRQAQAMQIKLSELCNGENPVQVPILKKVSLTSNAQINQLAIAIRNYFSISLNEQTNWESVEKAFDNWRNLIENHGIFVFKDAFKQNEISGFCLYDNEFPIIYVNNSMTKTRQIFTLFHELAHLLFRTGGIDKLKDNYISMLSGENRAIEIFCNKFAADFLVPDDDFNKRIKNNITPVDEEFISTLSDLYKVSREVILRKLLERDLVSREYYEQKSQEWVKDARRKRKDKPGGDYYLTKVTYLGKNYLELAFRQYYKKHISLGQLAEYLNVKIDYISKLEIAFHGKI